MAETSFPDPVRDGECTCETEGYCNVCAQETDR